MNKKCIFLVLFSSLSLLAETNLQKFYVNSIPKCGTHLLTRTLELMTGQKKYNLLKDVTATGMPPLQEDEFPYFHVAYSKVAAQFFEKNNYKCFFIYRDPRDEVVSYAYWRFVRYKWKDHMNFPQVINQLVDEVVDRYNAFLPWMSHPLYYSLKFESLIGSRGGGTDHAQIIEFANIANHIGFKLVPSVISTLKKELFGHGGTFREGKIGSWKEHFTEDQKKRFKEKANHLLIELGYETSDSW